MFKLGFESALSSGLTHASRMDFFHGVRVSIR